MTVSSANSFVYPYGTTEKFPAMADSNGAKLSQTAHYYQECSNKGVCDRSKGQCQCLDGYEGVACQRASCPGTPTCSGHGTCQSISQLAAKDNNNVYKLWDKDSTMGCLCDSGYEGPDCSERQCKYGVDPLYLDDTSTVKYSEFNFATLIAFTGSPVISGDITKIFSNGLTDTSTGNGQWAIRFYDANGEDWLTDPLNGYATCDDILNALYALPNNAVPLNSVYCEAAAKTTNTAIYTDYEIDTNTGAQWQSVPGGSTVNSRDGINKVGVGSKLAFWEMGGSTTTSTDGGSLGSLLLQGEINSLLAAAVLGTTTGATGQLPSSNGGAPVAKLLGAVYNLRFLGNPGKLKQPEIEIYLDGNRPSLLSSVTGGKVITKVWTDGQQGENVDYFADHCNGIKVSIDNTGGIYKLDSTSTNWESILKTCLGASDFNDYNNIDVNNWDKGNKYFPHLIKLVKSPTIYTDGGYYVAIYSDGNDFLLVNPFRAPGDATAAGAGTFVYDVYTTTGTLALTSDVAEASFGFGSKNIFTYNPAFDPSVASSFSGDVSCDLYTGARSLYENKGSAKDYNTAKIKNIFPKIDTTKSSCDTNKTPNDCSALNTAINTTLPGQPLYGDASQGTLTAATAKYYQGTANSYCLNKGDLLLLLNFETPAKNAPFINIHTVNNLKTVPSSATLEAPNPVGPSESTNHIINVDIGTNWAHSFGEDTAAPTTGKFLVYKFIPAKASSYQYVAECSNRGICARDTGVCQCFPGYSADNCHTQSSLAL